MLIYHLRTLLIVVCLFVCQLWSCMAAETRDPSMAPVSSAVDPHPALCFERGIELFMQLASEPTPELLERAHAHFQRDSQTYSNPISKALCDQILEMPGIGKQLRDQGEKPYYVDIELPSYVKAWRKSLKLLTNRRVYNPKTREDGIRAIIQACSIIAGEECIAPAARRLAILMQEDPSIAQLYRSHFRSVSGKPLEDIEALLLWRSFVLSGDMSSLSPLKTMLDKKLVRDGMLLNCQSNIRRMWTYIDLNAKLKVHYPYSHLFASFAASIEKGESGWTLDPRLAQSLALLAARFGHLQTQVKLFCFAELTPFVPEEELSTYLGEVDKYFSVPGSGPQGLIAPADLVVMGERILALSHGRERAHALQYFSRALDGLKGKAGLSLQEEVALKECFHRLGEEVSLRHWLDYYAYFSQFPRWPEVKQDFARELLREKEVTPKRLLLARQRFIEALGLFQEQKSQCRVRSDLLLLYNQHPELTSPAETGALLTEQAQFDPDPQWKVTAIIRRLAMQDSCITIPGETIRKWADVVNRIKSCPGIAFERRVARMNALVGEQYLNETNDFPRDLGQAERCFLSASTHEPSGHMLLANLYQFILHDPTRAIIHYGEGMKKLSLDMKNIGHQQILLNVGFLLMNSEHMAEQVKAVEYFNQIIEGGTPGKVVADARFNLALMHLSNKGGLSASSEETVTLLKDNPDPDAIYHLGYYYLGQHRLSEAEEKFKVIAGTYFQAAQNLGVVCLLQKRPIGEAKAWFQKAYTLGKAHGCRCEPLSMIANGVLQCVFQEKEPQEVTLERDLPGLNIHELFRDAQADLTVFPINAYVWGIANYYGLFGFHKDKDLALRHLSGSVCKDRSLSRIEMIDLLIERATQTRDSRELFAFLRDTADPPEQWKSNTHNAVYASFWLGKLLYEESKAQETFRECAQEIMQRLQMAISLEGASELMEEVKGALEKSKSIEIREQKGSVDWSPCQSQVMKKTEQILEITSQKGVAWPRVLQELKSLVRAADGKLTYKSGSALQIVVGDHKLNLHAIHGKDDFLDRGRAEAIRTFVQIIQGGDI